MSLRGVSQAKLRVSCGCVDAGWFVWSIGPCDVYSTVDSAFLSNKLPIQLKEIFLCGP